MATHLFEAVWAGALDDSEVAIGIMVTFFSVAKLRIF